MSCGTPVKYVYFQAMAQGASLSMEGSFLVGLFLFDIQVINDVGIKHESYALTIPGPQGRCW